MTESTRISPTHPEALGDPRFASLQEFSTVELAQALAERLALKERDWHRLKSNRKVRSLELVGAALVFLLKDQSQEALLRLQQAVGWLDRSLSAPPCPQHGKKDRG
ncbi:MAG: DUF6439 family protein [Geitlerinemataceae cyanobacterium]